MTTGIGQVELCRVATSDGLLLDGALRIPSGPRGHQPIDACLLVHGTGSNFTAPGLMEAFANQASAAGIASLRVNTRGHDLMALARGELAEPRVLAAARRIYGAAIAHCLEGRGLASREVMLAMRRRELGE